MRLTMGIARQCPMDHIEMDGWDDVKTMDLARGRRSRGGVGWATLGAQHEGDRVGVLGGYLCANRVDVDEGGLSILLNGTFRWRSLMSIGCCLRIYYFPSLTIVADSRPGCIAPTRDSALDVSRMSNA